MQHTQRAQRLFIAGSIVLAACTNQASPQTTPAAPTETTPPKTNARPTLAPAILATAQPSATMLKLVPALAERAKRIDAALKRTPPILLMADMLSPAQAQAQDLAVANAQIQKEAYDPATNAPVRYEVMGIYPTRESDLNEQSFSCKGNTHCQRVELYNYAFNFTLIAIVDVNAKTVLSVNRIADAQPDISPLLTDIAVQIAIHSPEVQNALGYTPESKDALMANTKTSLNRTQCERSRHLCVAPTFVWKERALWAIVNLTEGTLVGVRWTDVGRINRPNSVTEKSLQNDFVTTELCQKTTTLERDGWKMDYMLTSSDGLRLTNVSYNGKLVVQSAKVVDWHVSYSRAEGFGYSDAVGCPVFSQAAVVAQGGLGFAPIQENGKVTGFSMSQNFYSDLWPAPCNYFYRQTYEFYLDGRWRPAMANLGRGCGNDGVYRPVLRLAFGDGSTFSGWDGTAWQDWTSEQWQLQTQHKPDANGNQFRMNTASGGFLIAPGNGQFKDNRNDNAFIYITRDHADKDEGETDLITIGPCCNTDFRQGPEKFIDAVPEPIVNAPLVLWYVPQIKNDDRPGQQYCWVDAVLQAGVYEPKTYPCEVGPMFKPS